MAQISDLTGRPELDKPRGGDTMVPMEATLNSRLAMIQLPDTDGREVRLGALWLRQPAVIVFLRHYG
jgi:hypothetical protein